MKNETEIGPLFEIEKISNKKLVEDKKKMARKRYYEDKKKVVELERRNFRYLILFPASDAETNKKKFYTMGGNSAIIYVRELAPRIHRKAILRFDKDNCSKELKFGSGICMIADLEGLEERLKEINIFRVNQPGEIVFFKLPREYAKAEIREMFREEQKRTQEFNELVYSEVIYPKIHRQILTLKKVIPVRLKNMDKSYREIVGREMITSLMKLIRNYTEMTHGDKDKNEALREMKTECDMVLAELSLLNEIKAWELAATTLVAETTVELMKQIETERRKLKNG